VQVALPLCRACNARWEAGLRARWAVLAALGVSALAAALGFLTHDPTKYAIAAIVFAAALGAAFAVRLRDRFIHAAYVQGSRAVLRGVCDRARVAIQSEARG
jgi:hypothetical protein